MSNKILKVVVNESDAGLRLDRWVALLPEVSSRSRAAQLIEQGLITLHGRPLKASYRVSSGTEIHIALPAPKPSALVPLAGTLDILFEDRDLIVINKPCGLVVHPSAGHEQDTLVNLLLHHTPELAMGFAEHRPGIVHRLDRDTSGVLVVAKNDSAHHALAAQFREKSAHRIYWAVTGGLPKPASGTIRSELARHPTDRKRFASTAKFPGKLAITHYRTLATKSSTAWIECRLETGRTHQIRVHISELGTPILGDPIYGGRFKNAAPRLMLHACELGFVHPTLGERLHFHVPWPDNARSFLHELGYKT